jgi:hypothetical protein
LSCVTEKNIDEWRLRQEFARHVDDFYPITRPRTQDHSATCSPAPSSSEGFLTAAATAYQASAMELSAAWQDRQIPMIWAAIASELDIAAWKIEKIVKQRLDPKHSPIRRKE